MSVSLGKILEMPPSNAPDSQQKRHAACDECRKRKLKCSGEATGCSQCIKHSLRCHYSLQKQMGRPPKKRPRADDGAEPPAFSENGIWPSLEDNQSFPFAMGLDPAAIADVPHLCQQLAIPVCDGSQPQPTPSLLTEEENHNHTWQPDCLKNPNLPVLPSSSSWPDFAAVSAASATPFPGPTSFLDMQSLPLSPPTSSSSDSTGTACTCLSYLYLCLSHISSIASFPVNSHTLRSLYIAARTAQNVIRCEACPKNFATGVQNIMLTGTLLTVLADAWLRVSKADPVELGMQAAPPAYITRIQQSTDPGQGWTDWLRQVVRRAVIGGPIDPDAQIQCSNQPDLLSLIQEIEDRQRRWHEPGQHPLWPPDGINPNHSDNDPLDECEGKNLLCVRIVGSARHVILQFNFEPQEYPDGVAGVAWRLS